MRCKTTSYYTFLTFLLTILWISPSIVSEANSFGDPGECSFLLKQRSIITLGEGTRIRNVGQIAFLGEDRMVISALDGAGLDVFARDGTYLRSAGNSFAGPFEVEKPGPITAESYSVHVVDRDSRRVLTLDYDGDLTGRMPARAGRWTAFISSPHGFIGYRMRPNRRGIFEPSADSGIRVPNVFSDIHSQAIFLAYPHLPLIAGTIHRYYFAFPGDQIIYKVQEGRVQRSNSLHDSDFRGAESPYRSFFAAELDQVVGRLGSYLGEVSRVVGVFEMDHFVVAVTSHDWKTDSQSMSLSVFSKGLRFHGLAHFSLASSSGLRRIPVGHNGNSIYFVNEATGDDAVRESSGNTAAGTRVVEYRLEFQNPESDACSIQ